MANVKIVLGLTLASALSVVSATQAQTPQPATDKFFANVNVGGQLASRDIVSTATKTIYEETATLTSQQRVGRGAVIDFGGGYRVWGDIFAGLVISHFGNTGAASTEARVPDPIFFNRPRVITGSTPDLKRSEVNVAPHALWVTPLTDKLDLAIAVGISVIKVSQDLAATLNDPPRGTQAVTVSATTEKGTAVGPYLGVDVIYGLTPRYGVGGYVRYAAGKVDLTSLPGAKAGGAQVGGGIRLRF
jgi:hypothetical protein